MQSLDDPLFWFYQANDDHKNIKRRNVHLLPVTSVPLSRGCSLTMQNYTITTTCLQDALKNVVHTSTAVIVQGVHYGFDFFNSDLVLF